VRGNYALATKRFEQALTRLPEHMTALLEFADHLAKLSDYDTTIRTVEKALTVEARSVRANIMLVELLLGAKQTDRALATAKAAESWAPKAVTF
jgi:lipopolysaccharide biosynthesis regulator YciM